MFRGVVTGPPTCGDEIFENSRGVSVEFPVHCLRGTWEEGVGACVRILLLSRSWGESVSALRVLRDVVDDFIHLVLALKGEVTVVSPNRVPTVLVIGDS